ncbi:MAG: hypothetical protein RIQ60_676 [Pseudomonadota bacterium]|jgi:hypothetical protein
MSFTPPALVHAEPGRPITAQAWNALVDAIGSLYDAVNTLGGNLLAVDVLVDGSPRADARVVAVPAGGGRAVQAVAPYAGQLRYQLAGLTDGAWQLKVSAPGCADASVDVTVPASSEASVSLTLNQVAMPDLYGLTVVQALAVLAGRNLTLDTILDVTGENVPKLNPPTHQQGTVVLAQRPAAGDWANANAAQVRLVVSAQIESAIVAVPNLAGMTLAQATAALKAAGLELGTTSVS